MMRERRSGIGRLAWGTFWVLVIVYIVHHPSEAATNARASIVTFLQHAARADR